MSTNGGEADIGVRNIEPAAIGQNRSFNNEFY